MVQRGMPEFNPYLISKEDGDDLLRRLQEDTVDLNVIVKYELYDEAARPVVRCYGSNDDIIKIVPLDVTGRENFIPMDLEPMYKRVHKEVKRLSLANRIIPIIGVVLILGILYFIMYVIVKTGGGF